MVSNPGCRAKPLVGYFDLGCQHKDSHLGGLVWGQGNCSCQNATKCDSDVQLWWVVTIVNTLSYPLRLRDFPNLVCVRFAMRNSDAILLGWDSESTF